MVDKPPRDQILDHTYDGIQEYDNPMPQWWVIAFWATIIFSVIYALNLGGIGNGAGRIADYNADMAAWKAAHPESGQVDAGALLAMASRPEVISLGSATFGQMCASCHGPDGGGGIGPNLADNYWLHGGSIDAIARTISDGVTSKGMPAWGKVLKPEQFQGIVAYVWSLHGTTPATPKEPQGDLVER